MGSTSRTSPAASSETGRVPSETRPWSRAGSRRTSGAETWICRADEPGRRLRDRPTDGSTSTTSESADGWYVPTWSSTSELPAYSRWWSFFPTASSFGDSDQPHAEESSTGASFASCWARIGSIPSSPATTRTSGKTTPDGRTILCLLAHAFHAFGWTWAWAVWTRRCGTSGFRSEEAAR